MAEVLLSMGDSDEAWAVLETIDDDAGVARQVALLRGFVAAELGNWNQVLAVCESQAGALYPVPLRLLHLAAIIETGNPERAFEPLLSADGTPISSPSTTVLLAVYDKLSGEAAPHDASLVEALKADPANVALFAHARACREMNLSASAYELFAQLDERLPAKPRIVEYLLAALAEASQRPDRVAVATRYTEEYPALAAAWLGLADVHHALDNVDAEREALEKAVEVGPDDVDAWLRYARFLDEQSNYPGLLRAARQLYELLPDDNLAYAILEAGGDATEALRLAQEAFQAAPSNPNVLHTLGLAELRTGNVDEGSQHLRLALEWRPGDPTLLFDAGTALIAQGKEEDGREYIRYALHYAQQLDLEFPSKEEAEQLLAGG